MEDHGLGYLRRRRSCNEGGTIDLEMADNNSVEEHWGMHVDRVNVSKWRHQWFFHNSGVGCPYGGVGWRWESLGT